MDHIEVGNGSVGIHVEADDDPVDTDLGHGLLDFTVPPGADREVELVLVAPQSRGHGGEGSVLPHLRSTGDGRAITKDVWGWRQSGGGVRCIGGGLGGGRAGGCGIFRLVRFRIRWGVGGGFFNGSAGSGNGFDLVLRLGKGGGRSRLGLWGWSSGAEAGGRGGGWRGGGLVRGKLAIPHGERIVLFAFLAAEGGIGSGNDLTGGGGISVALQSGAGIHILGFLQTGGVDKTIFRGNCGLRRGLGGEPLQRGDLTDLRNVLRLAEAGDGFRGKPEKSDGEKVKKGKGGRDQHIAPLAGLFGRVGHGHSHESNLGTRQDPDKAGSVAGLRLKRRSTVT